MSTLRTLATKTLSKYSARKHCLLKVVGEQVRMYCQMHKSEAVRSPIIHLSIRHRDKISLSPQWWNKNGSVTMKSLVTLPRFMTACFLPGEQGVAY